MARPWYPHYPSDYERKTPHLSLVEHGAYRLLLDRYYQNGGPLVANDKQLLRVCRAFAADEKAAVLSVLEQFFESRDGRYFHTRADEEIAHADKLAEIRQTAGAIGGAKTKAKRAAKKQQLPPQFTVHSDSDASHLPSASPLDLKKELWSRGKAYLTAQGLTLKAAGEMLGKWRNATSDLAVLNALASAEANCVSEPIAYIEKTLKGSSPNGSGLNGRNNQQPGTLARIAGHIKAAQEDICG